MIRPISIGHQITLWRGSLAIEYVVPWHTGLEVMRDIQLDKLFGSVTDREAEQLLGAASVVMDLQAARYSRVRDGASGAG